MAGLKIRLAYTKKKEAKYIAHLDLTQVFDRALRRAQINVKYSEGFNPHPKISFGPPLAVGTEGEREYVDIDAKEIEGIAKEVYLAEIVEKLKNQLPNGVCLTGSAIRPEGSKALNAVINLAKYKIMLLGNGDLDEVKIAEAIQKWLTRDEVITERWHKGKKSERNIRQWVKAIRVLPEEATGKADCQRDISLLVDIAMGNEGSARPLEIMESIRLLEGLSVDLAEMQVIREGLYVTDKDGTLLDPIYL